MSAHGLMRLSSKQRWLLLMTMLVTFVFGSIHAFSVFLPDLEQELQQSRARLSLIYSFGLISLTVSVLYGHRIYALYAPAKLILAASIGGGIGLMLAAHSTSWAGLFIGYSLLFGAFNGLAYGFCLQLVGRNITQQGALAMAMVTAVYAVGAIVFSFILGGLTQAFSASIALQCLGLILVVTCSTAAYFIHRSKVTYVEGASLKSEGSEKTNSNSKLIIVLWMAYAASVFAGLMIIGHATAIIQSVGGSYQIGVLGAVCVAIGSASGGFYVAWKVSAENMNTWLVGLPLLSAISLALLYLVGSPIFSVSLLILIGFSYGAVIAVYPYMINQLFGLQFGPEIYAKVFTAWGFAGLMGPWLAGFIFDEFGTYRWAILLSLSIALSSSVLYRTFVSRIG